MKNKDFKYKGYEIIKKTEIAPEVVLLELKGRLNFIPGQFVQIMLDHFGEATFAPCSDPEKKDSFEIAVRGCGNVTNQLIKLLPCDTIKIRGPYGNGWSIAKMLGQNVVLIAGGIGLFPIRPLVYEMIRYKNEFKKITLIYGSKTDEHLLFENDLFDWAKKIDVKIVCEFTSGKENIEKGMITKPIKELNIKKNTIVCMCGPEGMFSFCSDELLKKDIQKKNIYISFERSMECGIGICQHCNIGRYLVCKDGPVFPLSMIEEELTK